MFQFIGMSKGIEQEVIFEQPESDSETESKSDRFHVGALRSASKLSIDPIKRHASYFQKCTGSNKRTVPNNRTVSCNWNRSVNDIPSFLEAETNPLIEGMEKYIIPMQ